MSSGSTGEIIGAVIGAAAAYFTGGLSIGLSIGQGALLGAAVGSIVDPATTNTQGPRLDDLSVQYSSYGTGIPKLWGNGKVAGNVVWSTPKIEVATTQSAGKGGGGSSATSYDYFVYMSQILCETPKDGSIVSIQQIWIDGALKWDATSGVPIGQALASATNLYASFELFQGGPDQLPDPVEEGFTGGPGSCAAYRGVVRVRMNAIECPGGRIPQFSFVLTTTPGAPQTHLLPQLTNGRVYAGQDGSFWGIVWSNVNTFDVYWSDGTAAFVKQRTVNLNPVVGAIATPAYVVGAAIPLLMSGIDRLDPFGASISVIDTIDASTGQITEIYNGPSATPNPAYSGNLRACFDRKTGAFAASQDSGTAFGIVIINGGGLVTCDTTDITLQGQPIAMDSGILFSLGYAAGHYQIVAKKASDGSHIGTYIGPATASTDIAFCAMQSDDTNIYLYLYESPTISQASYYSLDIQKDSLGNLTGVGFDLISDDVMYASGAGAPGSQGVAVFNFPGYGIVVGPGNGTPAWQFTAFNAFAPLSVKVAPILAELCELCDTPYDVSEIPDTDTVFGYAVTTPASARANMQPLLDACGIYTVDEDDKIKFRKLDNLVSVASIGYDELGQATQGDAPSDPFPLVRKQTTDLPQSLTITYTSPDFDFNTSSQTVIRLVTDAIDQSSVTIPAAITDDQAMSACLRMMYAAWSSQNTRTCVVSRKYGFVSPGDGLTIEYPRGTSGIYRVTQATDTGLMIQLSLEPGDPSLFSQTAVGATAYPRAQVAAIPAPLRAQILDIPILRDVDSNAGPYVALDSFASVPANGQLFVGDNIASLASVGTVTASAPIGFAETAIASHAHIGLVDEKNIFTINIGDDTFNSCTRDVLLANGGEFWALGAPGRWEIGSSASAASLGAGRFILSRHLRGLFGTDRFVGTSVSGDTFVILRPVGILRPDTGVGGIGLAKVYRAVTRTANPDNAATQTYANTGEGLMPLAPINLRRTNTNDFTVDRRSRMSMNNAIGALPIGETSEHYSWSFFDSTFTNLLGTVVTNVPTVTAAQQTAIGRAPSATAYIQVAQVSDSVGVGHALKGTI